jgi:hypothetical protein
MRKAAYSPFLPRKRDPERLEKTGFLLSQD